MEYKGSNFRNVLSVHFLRLVQSDEVSDFFRILHLVFHDWSLNIPVSTFRLILLLQYRSRVDCPPPGLTRYPKNEIVNCRTKTRVR